MTSPCDEERLSSLWPSNLHRYFALLPYGKLILYLPSSGQWRLSRIYLPPCTLQQQLSISFSSPWALPDPLPCKVEHKDRLFISSIVLLPLSCHALETTMDFVLFKVLGFICIVVLLFLAFFFSNNQASFHGWGCSCAAWMGCLFINSDLGPHVRWWCLSNREWQLSRKQHHHPCASSSSRQLSRADSVSVPQATLASARLPVGSVAAHREHSPGASLHVHKGTSGERGCGAAPAPETEK